MLLLINIYIEAVLAQRIEQKVYANQDKSLTNLQTLIMGLASQDTVTCLIGININFVSYGKKFILLHWDNSQNYWSKCINDNVHFSESDCHDICPDQPG